MATSKLHPKIPSGGSLILRYATPTGYSETGQHILSTSSFYKQYNETVLFIMIGGFIYTNELSATLNIYIDGQFYASASTTRVNDPNSFTANVGFGYNISAGDHTVSLIANTQGTNIAYIPAYADSYGAIIELV